MWDHYENSLLTPSKVSPGSGKPVHWKCRRGHEWKASVRAVVKNRGYCSKCNSLAVRYRDIAWQWDYKRNPDTPMDVAGAPPKLRFCVCDKEPSHSWRASVSSRTRLRTRCPQCANLEVSSTNNLQHLSPELAAQFDVPANGATPDLLVATSTKKAWWVCPLGPDHRWDASPLNRYLNGHGCRCCAGKQASVTNSLASLFPEIAAQFDSDANGLAPDQVVAGSNENYQWRCPVARDHVCSAIPNNRTGKEKEGCPACSGRQVPVTNSLETLHPDLAREMDSNLNGGTTAKDVVAGSNMSATWRCSVNPEHIWDATPNHRTSKTNPTGCSNCPGLKVLPAKSLAAVHPDIAAEWDPERNGSLRPDQFAPTSDHQACWICPNGHRWNARVDHRIGYGVGSGHAACNLTARSESELYLSFELSQFFEIDTDDRTIDVLGGETLNVDTKFQGERLVVEFEGAYWRRGYEERDSRKSEKLGESGWKVVRVRDHELGRISPTDVRVDTRRMSHKEIANRTLAKVYVLLGRDKAELSDYLAQPDLAKQAQAAAYIKQLKDRNRQRDRGS